MSEHNAETDRASGDGWFARGRVSGLDLAASLLMRSATGLWARGEDAEANVLRGAAQEIADEAETRRKAL